jgi:hypothetical protein
MANYKISAILQVTPAELARYDRHFKEEDLGKWVFDIGGIAYGFYDTREECVARVAELTLS